MRDLENHPLAPQSRRGDAGKGKGRGRGVHAVGGVARLSEGRVPGDEVPFSWAEVAIRRDEMPLRAGKRALEIALPYKALEYRDAAPQDVKGTVAAFYRGA
jgi:hypothetical protein